MAFSFRSEVLRLTRHVELMTQIEALFRSRLMPKSLTRFFLNNISITRGQPKHTVSVFPNRTRGFIDGLFLLSTKIVPSRRFMIKVFEIFVSGFIAPEHEPSLPKELLVETVNIALREHELDKRDRLLHLKASQSGVGGHLQKHCQVQQQPFNNQLTLTNKSSLFRTTSAGPRSSWRWTYTSETDVEDDTTENAFLNFQPQSSIRASWIGPAPSPPPTTHSVIPDPNARLEELRTMVLSLQSTVENLTAVIQQQQSHHSFAPVPQRHRHAKVTETTTEVNV